MKSIEQRLTELGVRESDLTETFTRSGGHGGQNVNKVSSCVILVHAPTGIVIRCETERSQALNRILARSRLADRLEHRETERKERLKHAAELVRRQKRRPSHAARRRNVEQKRQRGLIKKNRRTTEFE
jgi:protein subunit release factor B